MEFFPCSSDDYIDVSSRTIHSVKMGFIETRTNVMTQTTDPQIGDIQKYTKLLFTIVKIHNTVV